MPIHAAFVGDPQLAHPYVTPVCGRQVVASGTRVGPPDRETTAVAVAQGRRLARVAQVIGVAREHGLLDVRAGLLPALNDSRV
jgi:hypothetical protein